MKNRYANRYNPWRCIQKKHTGIFRKWKEIIRYYKNIEKDIGRLYLVEGQHNYQA